MSNPNKNAPDFASLIKDKFTMRKDIAPVETSATASRAYKVGEKFYYGNLLREATQDIAQGGTLTLNTNYKNADPVTTTIQNLSTVVSKNGAHNLLPNFAVSESNQNNVDCTVNADKSITVTPRSGGASARANFILFQSQNYKLPIGTYIFSDYDSSQYGWVDLFVKNTSTGNVTTYSLRNVASREINVNIGANDVLDKCRISVAQGDTFSTTHYLMLCLASDTDPTYEPYSKTNVELTTDSLATIDNRNILGAKNFMPITLAKLKAVNTNKTWDGDTFTTRDITVTFDVDSDGNVTAIKATGTATGGDAFIDIYHDTLLPLPLKKGSYILNGCPSGGNFSTGYALYAYNSALSYLKDVGEGIDFTLSENSSIAVGIVIRNGTAISGTLTFKPMIRLASDPDATYEPYAMGNRELTQAVENMKIEEITNSFGAVSSGITFSSSSHVYKQGKHIYGNLILTSDTAFTSTNKVVYAISSSYLPESNIISGGFICKGTSIDRVIGTIYTYLAAVGSVYVNDFNNTGNNAVIVPLNYTMA